MSCFMRYLQEKVQIYFDATITLPTMPASK